MHLIYDFDGTLYATHKYFEAWVNALVEHGLNREQIVQGANILFSIGFTLEAHADQLGLGGKEVEKMIKQFMKLINEEGASLLFPDVVPFLSEQADGHHQTILTFGNPDFQTKKIQASGLSEFIDDIRIARPERTKLEHLREMIEMSSGPITYIDNSPKTLLQVHEAGLPITLIRMIRSDERHSDMQMPEDDDIWQCISSLEEIET